MDSNVFFSPRCVGTTVVEVVQEREAALVSSLFEVAPQAGHVVSPLVSITVIASDLVSSNCRIDIAE